SLEAKRGNAEAWKHLLQQAIAHQQAAVQAEPRNREYREFLANHHHNLSVLLSNLGQVDEAGAANGKARLVYEELVAEFPAVPQYRGRLAASYNNLGDSLHSHGKLPEAESAYRRALSIQEPLAAEFSSIPGYREHLANMHHNLGVLLKH